MNCIKWLKEVVFSVLLCIVTICGTVMAATPTYEHNAILVPDGIHPGVYEVVVSPNDNGGATIGIPSIAKQTLENNPTSESPAIIMGAAAPFERKVDLAEFERTDGGTGEVGIYPPYNKFRYKIMEERGSDGTIHRKLSGYDGSYIIIRVDVSNLINAVPAVDRDSSYLHVKQEGNAVLMVELGPGGTAEAPTFSDALGNKVGSYSLASDGLVMKDTDGTLTGKPYIDLVLMSSGTLVAGADTEITDPTKPTADFKLKMYVDKIKDYNPSVVYDPNYQPPSSTAPTIDTLMMGKYFFDDVLFDGGHYPAGTVKPTATISSYKVKGSDLELEVVNGDEGIGSYLNPAFKYWSLRKALQYEAYNNSPIKLFCEVPVLEGLNIDGSSYSGDRKIILDVNSFDVQIANHKETGLAGLTIKNAEMMIKDSFTTTGAELAVGNNAKMVVKEGGVFIIDLSCQLEVEYDAASVTTPSEIKKLSNGFIIIENGGKVINNGVFTIEGTEGKPIEVSSPSVIRDMQNAILDINEGGILENNGCLLSYGELYCMGTIINNGEYNDLIVSHDPDKGDFSYHRGVQVSWKDDVTQDLVHMGGFYLGKDDNNNKNPNALIDNRGDIVLVPGVLDCYGKLKNNVGANVYMCPVEEAMIPIVPTAANPLLVEKLVKFGEPIKSHIDVYEGGSIENAGNIRAMSVEIVSNGRTGNLTPIGYGDRLFRNLALFNSGTITNSGIMSLDAVYTYGEITNSGVIGTKVIVSKINALEGALYDDATTKLVEVYSAKKEVNGSRNIWRNAACSGMNVTPGNQKCNGGTSPNWTVIATTSEIGNDIKYWVDIFESVNTEPVMSFKVDANVETPITGPVLDEINSNIIYNFRVFAGEEISDTASVTVSSEHVVDPTQIGNLVYNGKEQNLITAGGANVGALEYRLGETGTFSSNVPTAKNAGTYRVYYKLTSASEPKGHLDVVIGKRPVTVSGVDIASKIGTPLKPLNYTVSGIVEGETLNGVYVSTSANIAAIGEYAITVTVNEENPNYEITIYPGTYTVINGDSNVTVKDKYGVYSDDISYKGFNIDLAATPSTLIPYYSFDVELNATNYNTAGYTSEEIVVLPATANRHTVYYYITDGTDAIKGKRYVIIEKATQSVPNKVIARAATAKNRGDCWIEGLEPRAMEYRKIDNDGTYKTVYYEKEYVLPGDYLVRRIGDENHYPSPDYLVRVLDGSTITVSFFKNETDETPIKTVTGLTAGDLVPRFEDPTWEGYHFLGWYCNDKPFNFDKPIITDCKVVAHWDDTPAHVHETQLVNAKDATCTEAGNKVYYICTKCQCWFEDAFAMIEITDRASVIIDPIGHSWNKGVVTKQPTYTVEGIKTYTCLHDSSHTKAVSIPKKKRSGSSGGSSSDNYAPNLNLVKKETTSSNWERTSLGWRYLENGKPVENAWRHINVNGIPYWYHFGEEGAMETGWIVWNNCLYYLHSGSDGKEGQMLVGWNQIDGKWYYFEPTADKNQGHMYCSEFTPDGFYIGVDGAWDGRPTNFG